MDCALESAQEKRARFLGRCLEILEDDLCGKRKELQAFYSNCIAYLATNESLPTSKLRECDKRADEDEKMGDKTYRAWLQKLSDAIEENQNRLKGELPEHGLTYYPKIEYSKGGGAKVESCFFIDTSAPAEPTLASASEASTEFVHPVSERVHSSYGSIRYITEKIRRPPWYLKVANPLFRSQRSRAIFALTALVSVFVMLPVAIGYIYVGHPNDPWLVAIFALLLAADLLLTSPTLKVLRLITRKIAIVDSIRLPLSSVCISEITKITSEDGSATERKLSVVTVSANCPICDAKHGLKKSVVLEQKGILKSQIVGVCYNNPMMHQFTFDKDLMEGERLLPT